MPKRATRWIRLSSGARGRPTVTPLRSLITWVAPLRDGIPAPANGSRYRPTVTPLRSLILAAVLALLPSLALAQESAQGSNEPGFVDSFSNMIAASVAPRWEGPTVPWPEPEPRPPSGGALTSSWRPVSVHLASEAADTALAADALAALEHAHDWLERHDWPTPPSDAGLGGTPGFDLYLVDDTGGALAREAFDAPIPWQLLDSGITHARMDIGVDPRRLHACVVSAYVRASLLALDPAEAPAWRAATGDYVAWLATGQLGCSDESVIAQQQESWRTWVGSESPGGGGALFLAMLSARTDGLSGSFIRDLWSGAPQRSWETGEDLRATPDMWQVVNTVMDVGRDPLQRLLEEMAVARYFTGERVAGAPLRMLRELPPDAVVPLAGQTAWTELPRRFEPHELELEPYGSAYLVVDTRAAQPGSTLRIWLRGEYGVGWGLNAVRLSAEGTEQGRVRAPVRPRTPRSYIPLELVYGETAQVVIVVTNLGTRLADADTADDQVRSFQLILDKVEP